MDVFEICIKGIQDSNSDGTPDIRIRAEAFGLVLLDQSVDLDPKDALRHLLQLGRNLGVFN